MKRLMMVIPLVLLLCFTFACQKGEEVAEEPVVDLEAEAASVKDFLYQFEQALGSNDLELVSKFLAQDDDLVFIGTDEAEYWTGWQSVKEAFIALYATVDSWEIIVDKQTIKVHKSAEVAWFSERFTQNVVVQGETITHDGLRLTGVLEKRNGNWILVQFHCSQPVSGQLVEY
jgi:ketosteroid isomerase-like protein